MHLIVRHAYALEFSSIWNKCKFLSAHFSFAISWWLALNTALPTMNIQAQTHVWTYSVNNMVTNTMFTIGMRHVMGHSSLQITGISSITAYSPGLCDQHALCCYVFICNIDLSFRNQRSCSLVTWCDAVCNDATFSCIGYWNKVLIFIDQYDIQLLMTLNQRLPLIRCWNWTHGTSNFLLEYW